MSTISVTNCYNTGNYSAAGRTGFYSPIVAIGFNCSFSSTCGSLDFGWNPKLTNVTYSPGFVSSEDMKNSASILGSNFKSASGSENRRLSVVDLAMIQIIYRHKKRRN